MNYVASGKRSKYSSSFPVRGVGQQAARVVSLDELLMAEPRTPLSEIMTTQVINLEEGDSINEAKEKFTRYGFGALPVTDADDIIHGVVPYRDIMELEH